MAGIVEVPPVPSWTPTNETFVESRIGHKVSKRDYFLALKMRAFSESMWPLSLSTNRSKALLASQFKCQDLGNGKGNFDVPNSQFPGKLVGARSLLHRHF